MNPVDNRLLELSCAGLECCAETQGGQAGTEPAVDPRLRITQRGTMLRKEVLPFLLFFILLFTGCGRSSAPARMKLTPMDIPQTEREFIETARQNDPTGAGLVVDISITHEERDRISQTPPMIASLANHLEIIRFLLARKAEGNPQDNESGTAPATAAWMGNSFLALVADGVDPNTMAYAATTSVMFAVWDDRTSRPISDPRDTNGQTALNRAGIEGAKRQ